MRLPTILSLSLEEGSGVGELSCNITETLPGEESRVFGTLDSLAQSCQDRLHVAAKERLCIQPEAGKFVALEEAVRIWLDLFVLSLAQCPPNNAVLTCNPCDVLANAIPAIRSLLLMQIIRKRTAYDLHYEFGCTLDVVIR